MKPSVLVDSAGGQSGGAARFRYELLRYIKESDRHDIRVIGAYRQISPAWLLGREVMRPAHGRRIALNNISFVTPGSARWVLLRNLTDFLTDDELASQDLKSRIRIQRRSAVVHWAAKHADLLIVPSTIMAERVTRRLPDLAERTIVRHHPVSADSILRLPTEPIILCPVIFRPYKRMTDRLSEFIVAMEDVDSSIRLQVTTEYSSVPSRIAENPRVELIGQLDQAVLRNTWSRSIAIFFPPGIESFGYPLAEARASGFPVIAPDYALNREIAGASLCSYKPGDEDSLREAILRSLKAEIAPDPMPFDPKSYFEWLLGEPR